MESAIDILKNKIKRRDEDFQILTYDNGYMIQVGGRNDDDNWTTCKVFAGSIADVQDIVDTILVDIPLID